MYISPKRVRAGSRVAVVAPASTFSTEELQAALDVIRECGLEPVAGPCVKKIKTNNVHSAPVQDRAAELNWAFSSPEITAVIAVRGGQGSAAVLPYLNYDIIKKSKKPFLGKSDLTAVSMGLLSKAQLISINGRGASIRNDKGAHVFSSDCKSLRDTLALMMSDQPWGTKSLSGNLHFPRTVSPGAAVGTAVGGNCDTFKHLIGTDYLPDLEGAVLFLEDVHKSPTELSRSFLYLKLSGILQKVSAVVLGEFTETGKKRPDEDLESVILEYFSNGPPCIYGVSFSHGIYACPIPLGAECEVNASEGYINFNFQMSPAVR